MSTRDTQLRKCAAKQWLTALAALLFFCLPSRSLASSLTASNVVATTPSNQFVLVSPLSNVTCAPSNQVAILQVTQPAHGTVSLVTNVSVLTPELSNLFEFAAVQLSNSVVQVNNTNLYPRRTLTNGTWTNSNVNDWIGGFFPGAMWYIYEQTGDTNFLNWARKWTAGIAARTNDSSTDDIGFMINTSFGNGYRITGDTNYLKALKNGAKTLGNRYNATVRSIQDDRTLGSTNFEVILDTMMNGDLLYHVTDLDGDTNLSSKIYNHQLRAMTNQVRADSSTFHRAIYSTVNGSLTFQGTRAGYTNWSTWSRGHSWAIYMFTKGYIETGYLPFLDTAQRVSDYYITNVPSDYVPYWDYQAPNIPNEPRDSSAAAIAMSGMLQLCQVTTNFTNAAKYWAEAHNILESLGSSNYLAKGTSNSAILLHGTGETPVLPTPEIDVGLIYGDYYFVESLRRFALIYGRTNFTYTPNPGFSGADSFSCLVCDSAGNCSTAAVTVVVEPTNAPSPFTVSIAGPQTMPAAVVTFPTVSGYVYDVQYRDDAQQGSWQPLVTNIIGAAGSTSVTDSVPAGSRYYRVLAR